MRPTRALIDRTALAHNLRQLQGELGPGARQMAVVKADAYGHGAVPVARTAMEAGADWLGVATAGEGQELRAAGLVCPILVLAPLQMSAAALAVQQRLSVTVCGPQDAERLSAAAGEVGGTTPVHLKVDTGMGRLGVHPREVLPLAERIAALPGLRLEGVFSHFAAADEADLAFSQRQWQRFRNVLDTLQQRGIQVPLRHMANTAATLTLPESHLDLVRNGIGIYGLYPSRDVPRRVALHPVLSWVTEICQLKRVPPGTPISYGCTYETDGPRHIATLPVGYADGYPRLLSNRGSVLVRGHSAPVVGRVCMDMILADVSGIPEVADGDPVTLLGRDGDQEVSADQIAELCGTINYEVTCNVGKRVPRVYLAD